MKNITFDQSALILVEVGKALIDAGLIDHDKLDEIAWGVRTRYARDLWNRPATPEECLLPPKFTVAERAQIVVDFTIPPRRR